MRFPASVRPIVFRIVSCLRRLFTLGILQEKILERLSGKNECGKILRTRGQTQLHVDIGDLVEGIVTDIAVRIFIEHLLVGLARFFDFPSRAGKQDRD